MGAINIPQRRQKEESDPLDLVMKGLNIASSVYGIYSDTQRLEEMKKQSQLSAESAEQKRTEFKQSQTDRDLGEQNIVSPAGYRTLVEKGFEPVDPPEKPQPSILQTTVRTKRADGGFDDTKVYLRTPQQAKFGQQKTLEELRAENRQGEMKQKMDFAEKSIAAKGNARLKLFNQKQQQKETEAKKTQDSETLKNSSTLRKEYNSHPVTEATTTKFGSNELVQSIPDSMSERSPQDEVGLVFATMKMWDPTSAVKEGEYKLAEEARGMVDNLKNYANKLQNGDRLTDQQVAEMKTAVKRALEIQSIIQAKVDARYSALAVDYGLKPEQVIFNWQTDFSSTPAKTAPKVFVPAPQSQRGGGLRTPQPKPEMSPEDAAAKQWALENPKDPRAIKIIQSLKARGL